MRAPHPPRLISVVIIAVSITFLLSSTHALVPRSPGVGVQESRTDVAASNAIKERAISHIDGIVANMDKRSLAEHIIAASREEDKHKRQFRENPWTVGDPPNPWNQVDWGTPDKPDPFKPDQPVGDADSYQK